MTFKSVFDNLFRDKHGKIVVAQWPNIPLLAYLALSFGSGYKPIQHKLAGAILYIGGILALAIWSWQEVTNGVNYFRRILGVIGFMACIMMAITSFSMLKKI